MEYINKILKEALKNIKNDKERDFLRELSTGLIPHMINDFSNQLNEIVNVVDNLYQIRKNYICTVPVNKEELEIYKDILFPVLTDDIKIIKRDKNKKNDVYLKKIFLDASYKDIEDFKNFNLKVRLKNRTENCNIEVYAVQCQSYVNKEKELLEVFESNNIDWEVLYTPYSRKFFEIYIKNIHDINIEDIELDYGKYTENIYENYFLSWNLEEKEVLSDHITSKSNEGQIYEYRIFSNNSLNDLVKIKNGKIFRIEREHEKLFVYSDSPNSKNWKLWNIKNIENKVYENLKFEILGNRKTNDFITRFKENSLTRTRSESEIIEIINSFSDIRNFNLKDITINEYAEKIANSFDMNNIFNEKKTLKRKNKDKMNLYFECPDRGKYFEDELSFLLSCIEFKFPEYEVRGTTDWI